MLVTTAALLSLLLAASPARAASSCVNCHESAASVSYLEHDYADWKASPHAKAGVSCDACHGGDAAKADQAGAHKGLRPSTDPKSLVYFTSVPGTCGSCHAPEAEAFGRSRHARELERTGRGPNCVTCHGSMANRVLAPRELERTCTLCHRKPTRAYATLLALNHSAQALERLERELAKAAKAGVEAKAQESARARARAAYRRAVVDWHTFRMDDVLKASQQVSKEANTAVSELELKEKQHGAPARP